MKKEIIFSPPHKKWILLKNIGLSQNDVIDNIAIFFGKINSALLTPRSICSFYAPMHGLGDYEVNYLFKMIYKKENNIKGSHLG